MTRKTTFILSTLLTAFSLVVIGAVAGQFTMAPEKPTPEPTPVTPSMVAPVVFVPPTSDPTINPTIAPSATPYPVTAQVAAMIAVASAPGAQLRSEPQLVSYNGIVAYEVITDRCLIYIDAGSGLVLYNSAAALPQAFTDEEQDDD